MNLSLDIRRIVLATLAVPVTSASAGDNPKSWYDAGGDAVVRYTDNFIVGQVGPGCTLPNLLRFTVGGWQSFAPTTNPYSGYYVEPANAGLLRFDLELKGVVNPPGSLSPSNYEPFLYGPSPVVGAVEIDIDGDSDTGGEIGGVARTRYLANVARFGRMPSGPIGSRVLKHGWDRELTSSFVPPEFERNGADFLLSFCGCYTSTILSQTGGNTNGVFEAGETWLIRGGFFQRAGGYAVFCQSFGGAAGVQRGPYVPEVTLRWMHSPESDTTLITLIFPVTMAGAAQLSGQPLQGINQDAGDHASLVEALTDLIASADIPLPGTPGHTLAHRWIGKLPSDPRYADPALWTVTALLGTAYETPVGGAHLAWTDTGFDANRDLDGDGAATLLDKQVVFDGIDRFDGTWRDAEGVGAENGNVVLDQPGRDFALEDVDGDGSINRIDVAFLCLGDFNRDGNINILDYMSFFNAYTTGNTRADLNCNGFLETGDFMTFLNAIAAGC